MSHPVPNWGQLALLIVAIALFVSGGVISLSRLRSERTSSRLGTKIFLYFGLLATVAVLVWHAIDRRDWWPLDDNFDTLIWLGLLLTLFVMYVQWRRPLRGIDWFVMPIVVVMLTGAAVFGRTKPHVYVDSAWSLTHRIATFGGAAAFAVAGAGGAMYLLSHRRLRRKPPLPGPFLGSLERLEHLTLAAVTVGFALLTIGLVTGFILANKDGTSRLGPQWLANPKFLLAIAAWVIYAVVLHSPINPSFRGRRVAALSILGFVLMIGAVVAVQFMPQR